MHEIRKYLLPLVAAVLLCTLGAAGAEQNDATGVAGHSGKVTIPRNGERPPQGKVPVGTLTRTSWEEVKRGIDEAARPRDEPSPDLALILRQIRSTNDLSQRRTLIIAYVDAVEEFPQEQKKNALLELSKASAPTRE